MKAIKTSPEGFESTYALLLRSEERERNASETAVYIVLILSAVFSIWQFGRQPVTVPTSLSMRSVPVQASELQLSNA